MKKVLCFFILLSTTAIAQNNKVISAWRHLKDYNELGDTTSLPKAKEAINMAIENPETKSEAKTWLYKAQISKAIFEAKFKAETAKQSNNPDKNQQLLLAYVSTSGNDLTEAIQAYIKTKELDVKGKYTEEVKELSNCVSHQENRALGLYNQKKYDEALPAFETAFEANTILGIVDSANLNNIGIVAMKLKDNERTKAVYQKIIDKKMAKPMIYASLADIYLEQKDTVKYAEVISKGRVIYPADYGLLVKEINAALWTGKSEEAIAKLKLAIEKNPKEPSLFLVLGNLYDNMSNAKVRPANADELIKNAEDNYKKAIELKADNYDAVYNLGVLYNNKGVYLSDKANAINDVQKFNAEIAIATEEFKKAQKYFERALELNPSETGIKKALIGIYKRTQQDSKADAMQKELNAK